MAKKKRKRTSVKRKLSMDNWEIEGIEIGKAHAGRTISREDASAAITRLAAATQAGGHMYISTEDGGKTFHISNDKPRSALASEYIRSDTVMHFKDRLMVDKIAFEVSTEALQRFIDKVLDEVVEFAKLRQKWRDDARVSSATSRSRPRQRRRGK